MYNPAGIYLQPPKLRRRKKDKIEAKGKQNTILTGHGPPCPGPQDP